MFTGTNIYLFYTPTDRLKTMFVHKQIKDSTNHTIVEYLKENVGVLIQPFYVLCNGPHFLH